MVAYLENQQAKMGYECPSAFPTTFIKQVDGNPILIASDQLYNHTYGMLSNRGLKARYTNIRSKNGYGRRK